MLPSKSLLLAALSATASATVSLVQVVHIVDTLEINGSTVHDLFEGSSTNAGSPRALFAKRATPEECTSSVSSLVATTPTAAPEILEWLETAIITDSCSLVAPVSLSSGIFSYLTAVLDWVFEESNVVLALSSKCAAHWPEPTTELIECVTGADFYFTGAANATATVAVTDALEGYSPPKAKDVNSAASAAGVSLSAVAVVGVLAFAASL